MSTVPMWGALCDNSNEKIPTAKALQSMNVDERNIYFEILNTTLAMFHQDYEYDEKRF